MLVTLCRRKRSPLTSDEVTIEHDAHSFINLCTWTYPPTAKLYVCICTTTHFLVVIYNNSNFLCVSSAASAGMWPKRSITIQFYFLCLRFCILFSFWKHHPCVCGFIHSICAVSSLTSNSAWFETLVLFAVEVGRMEGEDSVLPRSIFLVTAKLEFKSTSQKKHISRIKKSGISSIIYNWYRRQDNFVKFQDILWNFRNFQSLFQDI